MVPMIVSNCYRGEKWLSWVHDEGECQMEGGEWVV